MKELIITKGTKVKNFPKVKSFYGLSEKSEQYTLCIVEGEIIERFYALLDKLESQPQTIVCTRGDSKENIAEHASFFENDLNKVFTVGGKSNYHFNEEMESIYSHTYIENVDILKNELKDLIQKANEAMNKREREFQTEQLKYFTELDLQNFDLDSLLKLKVFLLHFFHTDGRLSEFKEKSPFLSIAYGDEKFSIARKFALQPDEKKPKEKGYVYLYSLNTGDPFYLKTKDLSQELNRKGAKWHYDKYNEILLINGMFPHYMLGIFEVQKNKTPRFIINPYLYDILEKNEMFDYVNGLPINQENFIEYATKLGYKNYFYKTKENKEYVNTLDDSNPQEVIRS